MPKTRPSRYKFIHAPLDPDLLLPSLPTHNARVLDSQRRRRLVHASLRHGKRAGWDYQPMIDASQQCMRNHVDLDDLDTARGIQLRERRAHRSRAQWRPRHRRARCLR